MSEIDPVKPAARKRPTTARKAGPTDITDPLLREEAKKAFVWIGIAAVVVLAVFLAQPLLVIFGGMVFAAMIDGEATIKAFKRTDGHVWLLPRNAAYAPIPGDDAQVLGRVVSVLRSL